MLAAYIRWAINDLGAGQVRQSLPALVPFALILTLGWSLLFQGHRTIALGAWSGGMVVLGVGALLFLNSMYAPPVMQEIPQSPLAQPIDFGDMIRVPDYRVDKKQAAAGQDILVDVDWQAAADPKENYWLSLQLVGADGGVASKDGVPSAGRTTTDRWRQGQVFSSQHKLTIPHDVQPGSVRTLAGSASFRPVGLAACER